MKTLLCAFTIQVSLLVAAASGAAPALAAATPAPAAPVASPSLAGCWTLTFDADHDFTKQAVKPGFTSHTIKLTASSMVSHYTGTYFPAGDPSVPANAYITADVLHGTVYYVPMSLVAQSNINAPDKANAYEVVYAGIMSDDKTKIVGSWIDTRGWGITAKGAKPIFDVLYGHYQMVQQDCSSLTKAAH